MKIILLKPYLVARTNGGEISMLERLRRFQSWGAEVSVHIALSESERKNSISVLEEMQTPLKGTSYEVDGIRCHLSFSPSFHPENLEAQVPMETHFRQILNRENPDLVWAHYTDYFATTAALQWDPDRTWIDLTDDEYPRQEKLESVASVGQHYRNIKNLMVASPYMERSAKKNIPWAETILLPNIIESLSEKPVTRNSDAWVFVNPTYVKGAEFAVELAKRMPLEKFIFVGNWISERPELLPANVTFVPRQKGLREVFKNAKGLLMPSVWQEAFGRVPLEAMAAGVPVITSDRGGLPETVLRGGICLPLEPNLWVDAMSQSQVRWLPLIQAGYERVLEYRDETERRYEGLRFRFAKILEGQEIASR